MGRRSRLAGWRSRLSYPERDPACVGRNRASEVPEARRLRLAAVLRLRPRAGGDERQTDPDRMPVIPGLAVHGGVDVSPGQAEPLLIVRNRLIDGVGPVGLVAEEDGRAGLEKTKGLPRERCRVRYSQTPVGPTKRRRIPRRTRIRRPVALSRGSMTDQPGRIRGQRRPSPAQPGRRSNRRLPGHTRPDSGPHRRRNKAALFAVASLGASEK